MIYNMVDFSNIKFRASSWGNLMTQPQSKEARERGDLSATCIGELIKIYNEQVLGRKYEFSSKYTEKGKDVEEESIMLYSVVSGEIFVKNEENIQNEWFTGTPDVYSGNSIREAEVVDDLKNAWSLDTFTPFYLYEPDKSMICQLNCYYSLTGAKSGHIVRTLIDCPPELLAEELRKLAYRMKVIDPDTNPAYQKAAAELEKGLTFPDFSPQERVIRIPVKRDEELIQSMKDKVPKLRNWLQEFHEKRLFKIQNR